MSACGRVPYPADIYIYIYIYIYISCRFWHMCGDRFGRGCKFAASLRQLSRASHWATRFVREGRRMRGANGAPAKNMPPPCSHGRQRYFCRECGGGGICEHGRRRSRCKECGGSSICEHGNHTFAKVTSCRCSVVRNVLWCKLFRRNHCSLVCRVSLRSDRQQRPAPPRVAQELRARLLELVARAKISIAV